ncbi:MAG: hypothetical protein BGO98_29930 [Myxococcales bacterium 68-20]|nr:hypothetical protein [Myxococcales bacterium]OJY16310.1 MAG: hypothetical protein BGO98_29930 [Myxococcales bacterium 68-20]
MLRLGSVLAFALALVTTAVACGDDDGGSSANRADGGTGGQPDAAAVVTNDTESKQTGKIIRAQTEDEAVEGATITIAGKTATTNATGDYELIVPRNTPYQMTVAADGFYKLLEQEWILKKETLDRGTTNLLLTDTANLLAGLLPGRKSDKGLVVVKVNPQPPCTSEEGSTLTIDPPGEAKVTYFSGSLPNSQQTSVQAGTTFSAAIYNVDVGVPLKITVSSPQCAQVPFPVDVGDVTYTGFQKAEPGDALSYMRIYIKDPVVTDAGAD